MGFSPLSVRIYDVRLEVDKVDKEKSETKMKHIVTNRSSFDRHSERQPEDGSKDFLKERTY